MSLTKLEVWKCRSELKAAIRGFFSARNYLELDTPVLVRTPGTEVYLEYFSTIWQDFRGKQHPVWLRSSPELHMKQALACGADRIFQMGPCFRNHGELGEWHSPEFTMLEWYETGISYEKYIEQTFELLLYTHAALSKRVSGVIDLPERPIIFTVRDAFSEFLGIKLVDQDPSLSHALIEAGVNSVNPEDDFDTAFAKALIDSLEPAFSKMGVVVLCDYPASQAALSVVDCEVSKRFEFYVNGVEICNAFLESLSESENRKRYRAAIEQRFNRGATTPEEDEEFYGALSKGIKACCGNALGVDRWLGLLLGLENLEKVIPFYGRHPFNSKL